MRRLAVYRQWAVSSLSAIALVCAYNAEAQTIPPTSQHITQYRMNVAVDEVILTFHAADAHGLAVNDLRLDELTLLDNGKPPRRVVAFQLLPNAPLRAGILMDLSQSMQETRATDRAIAVRYAQHILRQQTDQAFVMNFDRLSQVAQAWTNNAAALTEGIRNHSGSALGIGRNDSTALFDAIYRACLNQFGHIDNTTSGNFILLFSDGDDNISQTPLKLAVDTCQHANTAIYAFQPKPKPGDAQGSATLAELTAETGGQAFRDDDSDAAIENDLRIIEADLRNQYRLIYNPPAFKHDGSFHRIELNEPERVDYLVIRSGYYAPTN